MRIVNEPIFAKKLQLSKPNSAKFSLNGLTIAGSGLYLGKGNIDRKSILYTLISPPKNTVKTPG